MMLSYDAMENSRTKLHPICEIQKSQMSARCAQKDKHNTFFSFLLLKHVFMIIAYVAEVCDFCISSKWCGV